MGQVNIAAEESLPSKEAGGNLWTTLRRLFGPDITRSEGNIISNTIGIPHGLAAMPLAKRVKLSFEALPPSDIERRLIGALLLRPGSDAKALSADCGWQGSIWQTHFSLMCQKRAVWLWPADLCDEPEVQFLPGLLADYDPVSGSFRMKSEVAKVFRKMGLG